jgi:hypothetical protein
MAMSPRSASPHDAQLLPDADRPLDAVEHPLVEGAQLPAPGLVDPHRLLEQHPPHRQVLLQATVEPLDVGPHGDGHLLGRGGGDRRHRGRHPLEQLVEEIVEDLLLAAEVLLEGCRARPTPSR